jgi:hypothetical protein
MLAVPLPCLSQVAGIHGWEDMYWQEKKALLRFFRAISKQQQLAHVWLATSIDGAKSWVMAGRAAMTLMGLVTATNKVPLWYTSVLTSRQLC